jgi:endonuclease/exonuclease/phosphatase (EEP) superfamily protein YafD
MNGGASMPARFLGLALVAVGAGTLLAQFGRFGWLPELATHFRVHYLLALALIAPASLLVRRRGLALAAVVLALPNAWYTAPYVVPLLMPASAAVAPESPVSIVALNLWYRNEQVAAVRDYLAQRSPDVLVLSELTPRWVAELRPVTATYPYWMSVDRRNPWGLGVFSKYPLRGARPTDLGLGGSVNVVTTLALPDGDVRFIAVHLSSPSTPARAASRNRQLAEIARIAGPATGRGDLTPRIVVGDFNVTPFSPAFGDLLARTGLEDAARPRGLIGTWPTWFPGPRLQIDHCLTDASLAITSVASGPDVGSDHAPLEILLDRHIRPASSKPL